MKNKEYIEILNRIKHQVREAQIKSVSVANSQMLLLYWNIGTQILQNQQKEGWGAKIITLLSADLRKEFPESKGYSERNLKYMRSFAFSYPIAVLQKYIELESQISNNVLIVQQAVAQFQVTENENNAIVQQAVAHLSNTEIEQLFLQSIISKIGWSHHVVLIDKEPHLGKRIWYMLNSLQHGNSRNVLALQIESGLFERQINTNKISNFERTLPPVMSDYATYMLKDPFIFDFVQAKEKADERNIEEQLATHITKFLLELGQGFAFLGRQVHFEIGNTDFYADLLFYHTKLHSYVVVELKARPFEPSDASQLNFYVNVVNDKLKSEHDNDTIGLLLCKGKNEVLAEYALKGFSSPIGVSDYLLSKAIPQKLQSLLPQIEDIENELKEIAE